MSKAILIVSFGTSYEETRKKTIGAIEKDISDAFSDTAKIYTAWTSRMIISKLSLQGVKINTVCEAMEQMETDGITDVIIQPTHVINGIEYDLLKEDALKYAGRFSSLIFGRPLLTSKEDYEKIAEILSESFPKKAPQDTAYVLMGHGSDHYADPAYAALSWRMADMGRPDIIIGTVESYPDIYAVIRAAKRYGAKKVILAPFMIVAGDHANNDMAADTPSSWKSLFEGAGFETGCVMKGLGEYPKVRKIFVDHIRAVI